MSLDPLSSFQQVSTQTAPPETPSGGINVTSSKETIPTVDIIPKKITIEDLVKKYGLTYQQAEEVLPPVQNASPEDVGKIINEFLASQPQSQAPQTVAEPQTTQSQNTTDKSQPTNNTGLEYDFEAFKNAKKEDKHEILLKELARNRNFSTWDTLSEKEQATIIKNLKKELLEQKTGKSYTEDELAELRESFNAKKQQNTLKANGELRDEKFASLMTDIQIANSKQITLEEYQALPKEERNDAKYNFIKKIVNENPDALKNLSKSDKSFYENETISIEAARDFFGELNKKDQLTTEEISKQINDYNEYQTSQDKKLSRAKLNFLYLGKKVQNGEKLTDIEQKTYNQLKTLSKDIDLSLIPDFDSSNTTFRNIENSSAYKNAVSSDFKNPKNKEEGIKAWLTEQLTDNGKPLSEDEFNEKFKNILSGCSIEGSQKIFKVVAKMVKNGDIGFDNQNLANEQTIIASAMTGEDIILVEDFDEAQQSNPKLKGFTQLLASIKTKSKDFEGVKKIERQYLQNMNPTRLAQLKKENGWTDEEIYNSNNDVNINRALWNDDAAAARYRNIGAGITDQKLQNKIQKESSNAIKASGNERDYTAFSSSASSFTGEAQVNLAKEVMSMADSFSDEANIRAQKALASSIQDCETQNQLAMHNEVMTSSYSEVQEYASSNIHNYHESVQADAFKTTLKSGNEKAIEAAVSNFDKMADSAQIKVLGAQKAFSENVEEKYTQQIASTVDKAIAEITPDEQRQKFKNASDVERVSMIQKLIFNNKLPKDALEVIVKYCPRLLLSIMESLVKSGKGHAILNIIGKSSDVTYKVINIMLNSGSNTDKKVAAEYVLSAPTQFSKQTVENASKVIQELGLDVSDFAHNVISEETIQKSAQKSAQNYTPLRVKA